MNEAVRAKWVRALRSGRYKQTQSVLKQQTNLRRKDSVGYCCLGVLCNIYKKETGKGEWHDENNISAFILDGNGEETSLPPAVREWAGIDGLVEAELANYNDGIGAHAVNQTFKHFSFKEIAHFIENFAE